MIIFKKSIELIDYNTTYPEHITFLTTNCDKLREFINLHDEKTFIIHGVKNNSLTSPDGIIRQIVAAIPKGIALEYKLRFPTALLVHPKYEN